ncbi:hypothetical protein J7T55_009141 [Diaporthe amygdali]|uniref:uncharacterized protein n=1 Tax=Phomopsis amygdali TaxID=1214568 RepID=UPI0022FF39CF|nr:uncharacterized protein J7T55_009141 [Diaporthe amygdali]KAJ0118358.1 hypothetical protein J7T55_009141 [Diaporthe amygdali]
MSASSTSGVSVPAKTSGSSGAQEILGCDNRQHKSAQIRHGTIQVQGSTLQAIQASEDRWEESNRLNWIRETAVRTGGSTESLGGFGADPRGEIGSR